MTPTVSVVVPFFNEEATIVEMHRRLIASLEGIDCCFEVIFVNDGSNDGTAALLDHIQMNDPRVVIVHLSRNFGHQPAVTAGLDFSRGQSVIVMDGDLQDPPEVIGQFIEQWKQGFEVVYGVRTHRKEIWFKRLGYFVFYRLLRAISDLDIPLDAGDFCLMDRKVVDALKQLPEKIRFVRGLRSFVGYRQVGVTFQRSQREGGEPKYSFRKLVSLALDGLVSFSGHPLRLVTYLGLLTVVMALGLGVWVFAGALSANSAPQGWASTIVVVLLMGSVQLISLGIVGEYIRRIFLETKGRPTYIVARIQRAVAPE